MLPALARLLKQSGQTGLPTSLPTLEVNAQHALVSSLEQSPHFDELAQILFDQPARLASAPALVQPQPRRLSAVVQQSEAEAIMEVLAAVGGNRIAAARELGISERTLRYRLAAFRDAGLAMAGGRR